MLATMYNFISIHAPPRGATTRARNAPDIQYISIHAPPRGATVGLSTPSGVWLISIHAPPRGATITADYNPIENYISIHAPPRGATRSIAGTDGVYDIFQFTPLREGRLTLGQKALKTGAISIHAPPRGATHGRIRALCACQHHFNSRPSARGDIQRSANVRTVIFQFTPLREGRLQKRIQISIHAPPRGATDGGVARRNRRVISIHAPPRGATLAALLAAGWLCYFNSRPSARGDGMGGLHRRLFPDFNSRPSARGDATTTDHDERG